MEDQKGVAESSYSIYLYAARDLPEMYWNYVVSKWLRSYRHTNHFIKLIDHDAYFEHERNNIIRILTSHQAEARIAALTDDQDVALGFSVSRGTVLDYVYVHRDARRQGIAKKLVPTYIDTFTHVTKLGLELWSVKAPKAKLNPYI